MSREQRATEAEAREYRDPGERERSVPWFVIMVIGAAAACGTIYLSGMRTDLASQYGDSRTITALIHKPAPNTDHPSGPCRMVTDQIDEGADFFKTPSLHV
jgi:hypothetical protein